MTLKTWVAASVASWEIPDQNGGFVRWENPGKIIKLNGTKWWIFRCHVTNYQRVAVLSRLLMISLAYPVLNIHTSALHRKVDGQVPVKWIEVLGSHYNPMINCRKDQVESIGCCSPIKVPTFGNPLLFSHQLGSYEHSQVKSWDNHWDDGSNL